MERLATVFRSSQIVVKKKGAQRPYDALAVQQEVTLMQWQQAITIKKLWLRPVFVCSAHLYPGENLRAAPTGLFFSTGRRPPIPLLNITHVQDFEDFQLGEIIKFKLFFSPPLFKLVVTC